MKYFRRPLRWSTQRALATSGAAPTSGSTTAENFTGASRAGAELSQALNTTLDDIDLLGMLLKVTVSEDKVDQLTPLVGGIRSQASAALDQLDARASEYANASLDFCRSAEEWHCDAVQAELIAIAWQCAADAYKHEPSIRGTLNSREWEIPASLAGRTRAARGSTHTLEGGSTSWLVIAIRGTANCLDHVINLHGEAMNASPLFAATPYQDTLLFAHAGFLNDAVELLSHIKPHIEQHLEDIPNSNVLVTGHSAGGAVASLLHLAALATFATTFPQSTLSCITFGSPPVARLHTQDQHAAPKRLMARGHCLNIINEYDFVARADSSYVRSLIQLAQSETLSLSSQSPPVWQLPEPDFKHLGEVIVLRMIPRALKSWGDDVSELTTQVTASKVSSDDLSRLIFCRLLVHNRKSYQSRIAQLAKGCCNGRPE